MARALEHPESEPTYLEFFGMSRAPFARVSEATQVFHAEQYSLLYAHLLGATEQSDRLLVLCGANGSGKTTLLNRYIASLSNEISFATVDETCPDATQFYCELLRQLGFSDITGTLNELRHISREFLVHRGLAGDPVLVVVDNAHLVSPAILEQLRWLSEIVTKDKRVISLVLSGNSELSRIMTSPAMSLLEFETHTEFSIRVFSEQETDEYVRHRLRLAGAEESAKVTAKARPLIHRFSGGNPGLINTFCNALLTEALKQKTRVISDSLVRKVADERKFVPHVLPLQGHQGRRKTDTYVQTVDADSDTEERISSRNAPDQGALADFAAECEQRGFNLESLLAQVSTLSDELDATRSDAAKALQDVDARDVDINALLDKVAQQSKELEQTSRRTQDDTAEIESLSKALQENEQLLGEVNSELKTAKRASGKAETELRKTSQKVEKLEARKTKLQESVRELKAEQKKNTTEARRIQKAQEKEIAAQEKQITALEKSVGQLESERDVLRAGADEGFEGYEKKIIELEQYIANLETESETLRTAADEAHEKKVTELEQSIADLESESETLRTAASEAAAVDEARENKVAELEQFITKLEADSETLQTAANEAAVADEAYEKKVAELEQSIADLETESETLRTVADEAAAADEAYEKKVTELEQSIADLETDSETLRTAASEAAAANEAHERKVAELEQSLAERDAESETQRAAADEVHEKKVAELEQFIADLEAEIETLRTDAGKVAAADEAQEKRVVELEESLAELESESETLRVRADEADRLEELVASRDALVKELQAELNSYVEEITATQVKLSSDLMGTANTTGLHGSDVYSGDIATIEVFKDGMLDRFLILEPGQKRLMIGRSDDSELCLNSKFVSRHHALMCFANKRAYIEDLRSYNGTIVNAKKVSRCELRPDDKITIGDFELRPRQA